MVPLLMEGDERDPMNYRGITLLSIVGKVYTRILADRIVGFLEREGGIVEEQGGFRPRDNRSAVHFDGGVENERKSTNVCQFHRRAEGV